MKLYNSLTNKKEEFKPITPGEIKMYVCGVTVYDVCHIGHGRASFIFDVMRRYFQYKGYRVTFVRNITDVDDKIINKARELKEKDLNVAAEKIASENYEAYKKDMQDLGIQEPDLEPKATGHIQDIIKMIQDLIKRKHAYESDGNVYFSVRSFKDYGKLSNQSIDEMVVGARVGVQESKKDPLDFALWKKVKPEEPSWDSPWGKGRPGWHIECSVMSTKYLGKDFDIHAGGRDLIFPHHENETAQSCCATDGKFAKYWLHNGLLTINSEKMAKSLGNFVTIQDAVKKYSADVLKLFFLQSHYRSPVDYTDEKMNEAQKTLDRFKNLNDLLSSVNIDNTAKEISAFNIDQIEKTQDEFEKAMDDDFNTPIALAGLFELVSKINKSFSLGQAVCEADYLKLKFAVDTIRKLANVLGLFQGRLDSPVNVKVEDMITRVEIIEGKTIPAKSKDLDEFIDQMLNLRQWARENKMYDVGDKIRDAFDAAGYEIKDLKDKTIVKKK